MTLNDFPAFAVEEITEASDELRLRGRFSHLAGVTLGRSYLYCGDAQWVGDLIEIDAGARNAVFTAPPWVQRDLIKVGSVVPWLPTSWQFFHVNMILMSRWARRTFVPSDAQHFQQGDIYGWTKAGNPLRSDLVPTHMVEGAWDHEECEICYAHVGRGGLPEGYVNQDEVWLCLTCFERYGRTRDLGFIFGT
jgi:hypothetical protein